MAVREVQVFQLVIEAQFERLTARQVRGIQPGSARLLPRTQSNVLSIV